MHGDLLAAWVHTSLATLECFLTMTSTPTNAHHARKEHERQMFMHSSADDIANHAYHDYVTKRREAAYIQPLEDWQRVGEYRMSQVAFGIAIGLLLLACIVW